MECEMETAEMSKRSLRSVQSAGAKYSMKREAKNRKSYPQYRLPFRDARTSPHKKLFPEKSPPKAVYFSKPVSLSPLYSRRGEQSYLDQIFSQSAPVGEGSFGVVYKVKSKEDDRIYAVKQMKSSHNSLYGYAEVQNYEKIGDHENCVKFYMAWEQAKIIHIQMEYCQLSLAHYAHLKQNIVEVQLWDILYDMLKALQYLHNKNLIHLDVKPGNIMMCKGFYKLADFGLLVDLNRPEGRKTSTISDGDGRYLACEVLERIYTYACDIFSLGITLVELATNIELPEFGPLWHEIRKKSLPSAFYECVTNEFAVIIEEMMVMEYRRRPTASKILNYSSLEKIKDQTVSRSNYLQTIMENLGNVELPQRVTEEGNIIGTPKRKVNKAPRFCYEGLIMKMDHQSAN